MIISAVSLAALRTSLKASFQMGFKGPTTAWNEIATEVPSETAENTYGWLGDFPGLREWVGDRVIKSISESAYTIRNKKFESTIGVKRDDIEDDTLGIYGPMFQEMGRASASHVDELIFGLLKDGFASAGYDNQNFFDTDHPVGDESVSNMTAGGGDAWFLMDTSRALKPLIYQNRRPAEFDALDNRNDENVFMKDQYIYGVNARRNVGFGFWQLAHGSKAELNADNFAAARASMMSLTNDEGQKLGVKPTLLVVGPGNGAKARDVIVRERNAAGETNIWKDEVKVLETPYLD